MLKPLSSRGAYQLPTFENQIWPNGVVPYRIDPAAKYCKNLTFKKLIIDMKIYKKIK